MPNWKAISIKEVAQQAATPELAAEIEAQLRDWKKAYRAGNVLALFEASELCHRNQIHLPGWIPLAALQLTTAGLKKGLSFDTGRAANLLARHQEDLKHLKRWEMVKALIADRPYWEEYQRQLRSPHLSLEDRKKLQRRAPCDPGKNMQETYVVASRALATTIAFGSPRTIENSYKLINRALKLSNLAPAYKRVSPKIYANLGLDPLTSIVIRPRPMRRPEK